MSRKKKDRDQLTIGGQTGPHSMERIDALTMGTELGGGEVVSIFWYQKHRCYIVTKHKTYFDVILYRSDTTHTRTHKNHTYADSLITVKSFKRKEVELSEIMIKIALRSKI